ncbi:MAG: desulfoferrodoxin [Proteobacteria bacterium]|nr:desulfoferrodoxin [Pseudomonadota bacterium]
MDRRSFLTATVIGSLTAGINSLAAASERYFPVKVDQSLFDSINRVKDSGKKTPLEMSHVPVISAPASVKAGELFMVEVSVGEKIHVMGPAHWIEYIELSIGNEPAGRVDFQPRGFMKPKVSFTVALPKDVAPKGKVTLVVRQRCNLHGLWESNLDITVV